MIVCLPSSHDNTRPPQQAFWSCATWSLAAANCASLSSIIRRIFHRLCQGLRLGRHRIHRLISTHYITKSNQSSRRRANTRRR